MAMTMLNPFLCADAEMCLSALHLPNAASKCIGVKLPSHFNPLIRASTGKTESSL